MAHRHDATPPIHFLGKLLAGAIYRVTARGTETLPAGGYLLLPNHLTWVDAVVLQLACPRPIRFIVDQQIYNIRFLNPIFRMVNALPISGKRAKDAIREAAEAIERGEIVCIFPEGELSRSGLLLRLHRGFELIARASGAPVVPVWLDRLWGSIFSFKGGRYFFKWPSKFPYPVTIRFGEPVPAANATVAVLRQRFLELSEACYQERPELKRHLGEACLRGLKKRAGALAVIDGSDGRKVSRRALLAAAVAMSRRLRKTVSGKRVAIVLPSSPASIIANLAVVFAGKTPVNLNFTAGSFANSAAIRISGITHCITARAVERRLEDFAWPEHRIHMEEEARAFKTSVPFWIALNTVLPAGLLARVIGIPRRGDREEAIILFTSGSVGEPKGVVLSHRNILGNVSQFALMLNLSERDSILANLPFFHSFGCTVTLWYPLIEGVRVVTYPNPLEVSKNAELIHRYAITLFCTTPTFLRGYLRKAQREQIQTVELLVTGAEKLPNELLHVFHEKFGIEVLQGYGLTETSPVVSVNLPDPKPSRPDDVVQPSSRAGSVGKLAPGIAAKITDPETNEPLSLHQTGMLWLRGPNIFEGYLNDPAKTSDVLKDGWFRTGDLGRFDDDGFLYIEGRVSRFSKIGGEMAPHETVESKICEVMELPKDERIIVITGVPDEAKGESLVLLSTRALDLNVIRTRLTDAGLPNLWAPRRIEVVGEIPVLASGKLDLKRCKEIALAAKPS